MGNLLEPPAPQQYMNIPPEGTNNLNRPHSTQMYEMVMQFAVPMFCIAALAITGNQDAAADGFPSVNTASTGQKQTPGVSTGADLKRLLQAAEKEAEQRRRRQEERVNVYALGLEEVLHVRCSPFLRRTAREKVQDALLGQLGSETDGVRKVVTYEAIQEVVRHDHHFCGNSRETNGKLRQLYVQNWRLQLELAKYKEIVDRLKSATKE